MSATLAASARAVSGKDLYLPVPTIKRDRNCLPAITNESVMTSLYGSARVGARRWRDGRPLVVGQLVLGQQCGRAGTPGAPLVHPPAVSALAYISSICVR